MIPRFPDGQTLVVASAAAVLGVLGVLLSVWGNPDNSGVCVSCFLENSAGALGLHGNPRLQYLRPELPGFVLGAFAAAFPLGEFRARGGSAPLLRFVAGFFIIVGCAVFIGCPIKLGLRFAAGDLSALAGVAGLAAGVWVGLQSLRSGVDFGEAGRQPAVAGGPVPVIALAAAVAVFLRPSFLSFSATGSGAEHAPAAVSLAAGMCVGVLGQRSRLCITGLLRDFYLLGRRSPFLPAVAAFLAGAAVTAVATGRFHPGMYGQPGAHTEFVWSFLAMLLVGWVSVIVGGCPFRQLIKAGEGDTDAGMTVAGMVFGAAVAQGWGIAATAAGVSPTGRTAVLVGLIFISSLTIFLRRRA